MPPPPPPARILVDADSGLQRLYGGYQTDWVCGGQWNAMLGYLAALSQACLFQGGLELVVVFNGTLGKERWPEWARRAQGQRQTAQLIVNHVGGKATPPPRAWFLPPACLSHCVRLAMFRFRVRVVQTLEDHHQEVLSLYRDYGFAGLIAQDSEFALCNVPAYFSSHALKLSWNGKNLTTHQYLLSEAARQLGLKTQHLPCFAALLGNHILPDEDLAAFHWSLLGPEHPLASLKVRAHQLVLPPCEVVIKAVSEYVSSIKDLGNLDAIARDVFKQSPSRMEDKVDRFKKAMDYFSAASKPRSPNVGPPAFILPGFGPTPFGGPSCHMGLMHPGKNQFPPPPVAGFKPPFANAPFGPGSAPLFHNPPPPSQECNDSPTGKMGFSDWSAPYDSSQGGGRLPNHHTGTQSGPSPSPSSSSDGDEPNDNNANHLTDKSSRWEDPGARERSASGDGSQGNGSGSSIPSLLSMATRSHMDITTPPLPQVSAEVLRVAEHRHRRGLMYPQIYHILTKGEMKMPVCIEDECNAELPPASLLFRAARQYAYGVLFSLAETQRRLERLALRKRAPLEVPPVIVKEWSSGKAKSALTPELIPALCFREWTCPNLRRLWLGRASEDRSRRTRAFLACLRSDCPALLNPAQVPQHLLLMCCVLRYMMQWPGGRILQRNELDAFLAQAVSNQLYEPDQLQELKVEKVDARGVQLAALFMAGVDTALFINDVCGQPLPWEHCCPWGFFDGKLFQSKLARATRDRAALLDMCEGQVRSAAGGLARRFGGARRRPREPAPTLFLLGRRSWYPKWRRCVRPSWRASICLVPLLRLPLCRPLPSCRPPWCPPSTPGGLARRFGGARRRPREPAPTLFLLGRRSWYPKWRRCVRPSWRASICLVPLLRLPLCRPLPSCRPPWCPPSTPCPPSTRPAPWAACLLITRIIRTTLPSTDPEPSQASSQSPLREESWRLPAWLSASGPGTNPSAAEAASTCRWFRSEPGKGGVKRSRRS
uniref:Family with sequence similarity 120 member C n=1 Tax=Hippocampus comes TaxID=109280 RepID=A0A3Q2Y4L7_HIPCM